MLLYVDGVANANPFADKASVEADVQNRAVPDLGPKTSTPSLALIGIIIAVCSGAACCCAVAGIVGFILVMRTMLAAQEKKEIKPLKVKPNVQLIDMRAVSSPLSPVDDNTVYSPATPGEAYSPQPYSPLPHHYHIVPPRDSVWSPTV